MNKKMPYGTVLYVLFALSTLYQGLASELRANQAQLVVDASPSSQKVIPETLSGIFFEEINHAGAGGLWAELVSNRGFEAGGPNTPSNIDPWTIIGDQSSINVATDRSSCFERNKIALRMDVLCGDGSSNACPAGGVGLYNPGYWGMNIEKGKAYKLVLYLRSLQSVNISVSLSNSDGSKILASSYITVDALEMMSWNKMELQLVSQGNNQNSRLQLTTTNKGTVWFDQVSLMPVDTHLGHGFRKDLFRMIADLKPRFLRFPGGCFVEGDWLRNAFRWRETVGPWEERPGHFGDVWMYWTDDGLGYYEFLLLAEDLGAAPIWVFNNGISHQDQVATSSVMPFVQDQVLSSQGRRLQRTLGRVGSSRVTTAFCTPFVSVLDVLDSLEFARGDSSSKWGSVRAKMGHAEPFPLKYVAIGNEDCWKKNYRGNYLKFYHAIKDAYPDIKIISNCDGSSHPLDHPADLYDYHVYTSANDLFSRSHDFDHTSRSGPKAFVSEYAVTGKDAGTGSLLAAVAEAGFLIGLEKNSDVVEMASYAPLFVNVNDRRWNPDAIVFNASHAYGTPSYWVQQFFRESSGATIHPVSVQGNAANSILASAITWKAEDGGSYFRIKVVNFGNDVVDLQISISGLQSDINSFGSTMTILTSGNAMDENSFLEPNKVVPVTSLLSNVGTVMNFKLSPKSVNAFDLALAPLMYRFSI